MKRRSTFTTDKSDTFDPERVPITDSRIVISDLKGVREERVTISISELSNELIEVLEQSRELHIRWQTSRAYDSHTPYGSRLPSGLHVFYSPDQPVISRNNTLCPLLRSLFSSTLKCSDTGSSFSHTNVVAEEFAHSTSHQLYSPVFKLDKLIAYLSKDICPLSSNGCVEYLSLLRLADYLDIDYDSISHALVVSIYWSRPPPMLHSSSAGPQEGPGIWEVELLSSTRARDKTELGILQVNAGSDPHDIHAEGYLLTLGDDDALKPTMFFTPSRHHKLNQEQAEEQQYTVSFDAPIGLHPTIRINFPETLATDGIHAPVNHPPGSRCALHTYLTLPSGLFLDEYAFPTTSSGPDPLFTAANGVKYLRALSGEVDLEKPDYVVSQWGQAVLLEVEPVCSLKSGCEITIPTHLRYLEPNDSGHRSIDIPWPTLFWACTAEEGTKFSNNPFDRRNLGYDGILGERTIFYHLDPKVQPGKSTIERVKVPVLSESSMSQDMVQWTTVLVVVVGFLWVAGQAVIGIWSGQSKRGEHSKKVK